MKVLITQPCVRTVGNTDSDIEIAISKLPIGTIYKIVNYSDIPFDEDFDGALTYDLTFDIDKCKNIQKDKLRSERKPLLQNLDVEIMMNITDSAKILEIEKLKQPLRDITKKVDVCKTLDEIRKVTL